MYTLFKIIGCGFRFLFLLLCILNFGRLPGGFIFFWAFIFIGWYLAKRLDIKYNPFYNRDVMSPEEHKRFRQASFELFGYIAKARGTVIKAQVSFLQNAIEGLPDEEQSQLHYCFKLGKDLTDPSSNCQILKQLSHGNRHLLHQFIEMCVYLVACDGVLDEEEHRRIMTVSRLIGVADYVTERFIREQIAYAHFNYFRQQQEYRRNQEYNQQNQYRDEGANYNSNYDSGANYNSGYEESSRAHVYNDDFQNALDVLGVKEGTPFKEIKRAYHKLANRYHPDRVATEGEEVQKVYTEKLKTINEAYEIIKARYGEK